MIWLGMWFFLGLSAVGTHFGSEYGVVYFFIVFPAFLFIYTIKETKRRNRVLGFFTLTVGGLVGYSFSSFVIEEYNLTYTTLIGIAVALVLHLIFNHLTKHIDVLTKKI